MVFVGVVGWFATRRWWVFFGGLLWLLLWVVVVFVGGFGWFATRRWLCVFAGVLVVLCLGGFVFWFGVV